MNPIRWGLCKLEEIDMFTFRSNDVKRLGGAGFLTEFGLCSSSSNSSKFECTEVMDEADKHLFSWTYWDYSDGAFFNSDGSPKDYLVYEFSRSYARAVTGTLLDMKFNSLTSHFELKFSPNNLPSNPPTEIYINKSLRYSNGVDISVTPKNSLTWTSNGNIFLFTLDFNYISTNDTISIEIRPKLL